MEGGLKRSLILHGIIGVLAIFGLPNLFKKEAEPVNMVMVELVPISSITNVPKEQEQQTPKEEPKKEEPKEEKKAPPPPPPKQEEPKPTPPEPEKKPEPEKFEPKPAPPKPKPEPKKVEEAPKKNEEKLDFDSVLKTVEKIEKKQANEEKKEAKDDASAKAKAKSTSAFDANQALSISERDAIIQQISQCWSIPAGAKDAQSLQVMLHLSLEKDGTVRDVEIVDTLRYNSGDSFYRAAAESAMRAVRKCSPLKNLPVDKYDVWKEIDMNFDPKDMLY